MQRVMQFKMKVYWSSVEYSYSGKKNLKGGFVYAFVRAFDVREVLAKLLAAKKKMTPVEIEYIMPYDVDTEWETPEETSKFLELNNAALKSNEVIFDDFYAYVDE
jgi:hypothetical protein